jgi:tetratricopeptide (TPR) repeat protein
MDGAVARRMLAHALRHAGELEESIRYYELALCIAPDDAAAQRGLAQARSQLAAPGPEAQP